MFRKHALLVLVIGLALGATLLTVNSHGGSAAGEPQVDLDMDITNGTGPCDIIDATRSAAVSTSFQVAVCLTTNPNNVAVAAFKYNILYNDQIIIAPEVADVGTSLDDNPDANVGTTTFGATNLGGGWDCTGGVGAGPRGDVDATVNGTGVAFSGGCGSAAGPNTLLTGVLGVINFTVTTGAPATLTLDNVSVTDNDLGEIGSCAPAIDAPAICHGGTVNNAAVPTATNTSTSTNTPTNTPTATTTNTPVPPTATNTSVAPTNTPTPTNTMAAATSTPTNTTAAGTATPTATFPPATGGPVIGPGTPTVTGGVHRLPILAVSTASVAYQGFNLQINVKTSAGVNLTSTNPSSGAPPNIDNTILMVDADSDGTPDPSSLSCSAGFPTPPPGTTGRIFGCTSLPIAQQPPAEDIPPFKTTSAGLLATFSFVGTGDGCVQVRLVDLPSDNPDVALFDTFTLFLADGKPFSQNNTVDTTPVNILFGTGTLNDCPGTEPATETPTNTATATNTAVPTDTATATPTNTTEVPVDTATPTNTPEVPVDTATPTNTPVVPADTATPTNTPVIPVDTATPTNTVAAPPTATNTSVPTATNTAIATETAEVSQTPAVSRTPEVTKTIQVTRTVEVTKTIEVTKTVELTKTVEVTKTPEVSTETPTSTPTEIVETETPTATATETEVPPSSTPTETATSVVTSTKTSVPTVTNTPRARTSTPQPTGTTAASSTRPAQTTTAVSTVLAAQTGPRGGAAGASALPNTGQGDARGGTGWTIAWLTLIVGFAGSMGVLAMKRRRG